MHGSMYGAFVTRTISHGALAFALPPLFGSKKLPCLNQSDEFAGTTNPGSSTSRQAHAFSPSIVPLRRKAKNEELHIENIDIAVRASVGVTNDMGCARFLQRSREDAKVRLRALFSNKESLSNVQLVNEQGSAAVTIRNEENTTTLMLSFWGSNQDFECRLVNATRRRRSHWRWWCVGNTPPPTSNEHHKRDQREERKTAQDGADDGASV